METIQVNHFSFRYATEKDFALKDLSFSIEPSEQLLICGESGSGKTTLLRQLKPELTPGGTSQGEILYDGEPLCKLTGKKSASEIGYLFQNPESQLVCDMVWQELAFGLENLGLPQWEMEQRVAETATFFGIESWMDQPVWKLSGGQKQILNLAALMIVQPKLLLLDEPTAQLDPISTSRFYDTLFRLHREFGTTMVISEHRTEELFSKVQRVVMLEAGELLFHGTPFETAKECICKNYSLTGSLPTATRIAGALKETSELPFSVSQGQRFLQSRFTPMLENKKREVTTPIVSKKDVALEVQRVFFRYEKESPDVLRECSFSVPKGCIFAVTGANGGGKSTLLRLLMGEQRPYRGKVLLYGQKISKYEQPICPNLVALLPQNPQLLFTQATVWDELCESRFAEEAEVFLQKNNLWKRRDAHPYDLSGGEQQRLAFWKATVAKPKILLLDEPTKGLDARRKRDLQDWMKNYRDEGNTILFVTHDLDFCGETADYCGLLFDGRMYSVSEPHLFFGRNYFYTTTASRISRSMFTDTITVEEVYLKCQKQKEQQSE